MVTTAGITRLIRSSSADGASASPGAASRALAPRSSGSGTGGAGVDVVPCGGSVDAGWETGKAVEIGEEAGADACRPIIHQTVPATATAATASNVAIWSTMDPADVC